MSFGDRRWASAEYALSDATDRYAAARAASEAATELGFGAAGAAAVRLAVAELASNVVRHGGGGSLCVEQRTGPSGNELRIAAWSRADADLTVIERLLELDTPRPLSELSARHSLGTGLGTVKRLADEVSVGGAPGLGLVVSASFHRRRR